MTYAVEFADAQDTDTVAAVAGFTSPSIAEAFAYMWVGKTLAEFLVIFPDGDDRTTGFDKDPATFILAHPALHTVDEVHGWEYQKDLCGPRERRTK